MNKVFQLELHRICVRCTRAQQVIVKREESNYVFIYSRLQRRSSANRSPWISHGNTHHSEDVGLSFDELNRRRDADIHIDDKSEILQGTKVKCSLTRPCRVTVHLLTIYFRFRRRGFFPPARAAFSSFRAHCFFFSTPRAALVSYLTFFVESILLLDVPAVLEMVIEFEPLVELF